MKQFILPCLFALLLGVSCEVTLPLVQSIPLKEGLSMPVHSRPVEIFYLRESLAKKPVTELALVRVNIARYASEDQLFQLATTRARELGADGLFVLNREEYMRYFNGDVYLSPEVSRTELRAVAFVYDENLRDSVRVFESLPKAETEVKKPKMVVKVGSTPQINLYRIPELNAGQVAYVVSDTEPMELLERTDVALYNKNRTQRSYIFKVRYRGEALYVSGFDVVPLTVDGRERVQGHE